jgi:hypothetical protein
MVKEKEKIKVKVQGRARIRLSKQTIFLPGNGARNAC